MNKIDFIEKGVGIAHAFIGNILRLKSEGATIPFIARYRKEMTGSADEQVISKVFMMSNEYDELIKRKDFVLDKISQSGKLTESLKDRIRKCFDAYELEEVYAPYKSSVKTKADKAKDMGLEPLAKFIMAQKGDINSFIKRFLSERIDFNKALQGAQYIIAEWIATNEYTRNYISRELRYSFLVSKVVGTKKEQAIKYKDYFDFKEKLSKCPSHRLLAILRANKEGFVRVKLEVDEEKILEKILRKYIRGSSSLNYYVEESIKDAYKRLLYPSLSNQTINYFKEKADEIAIDTFATNLRQLLLQAPLGEKKVLAIDPGFRTGCKVVCLNEKGDFLTHSTIFPNPPQNDYEKSKREIVKLLEKYDIHVIAIGDGTASRETEAFVKSLKIDGLESYFINESGASIYSASEVAREEFPNLDVTVRGAISIGRRLIDPLAELIKIDPKSIGVGQYQYDVNQHKLKESLTFVVQECVNKVGVNLNTASPYLLRYISGLGETLAANIVSHRSHIGAFKSINELKKVSRLGEKAFEQAAGFLRIRNGANILDNTGVHPESYSLVNRMLLQEGIAFETMASDRSILKRIDLKKYTSKDIGMPTLKDIVTELERPGLDIRGRAENIKFSEMLRSIEDLKVGDSIPGQVINLTNFGAFVNIGIKENALLHISKITARFIKHPSEILSVNQKLDLKVIEVDSSRKRISVSLID